VAHDLNNLLTGILGNLELLQNRVTRAGVPGLDSYLDGARHAGNRAAGFAVRLLAFSGQAVQEPSAVLVDEVVAQAVAAQGFAVRVKSEASGVRVFCDGRQFELSLGELLKNAATAVLTGGTVSLGVSVAGGAVVLRVEDSGLGMSPEVLARCRMPFFSTQPNGTGRGLGLPIAERFALSLGGRLDIMSRLGEGTEAVLALPIFTAP
jgi:signal transduction histidine kinase